MTDFEMRKYYGAYGIEADEIDVEDMLGMQMASKGKHIVRVLEWQAVKAQFSSRYGDEKTTSREKVGDQPLQMVAQPYVELLLRDVETGETFETRVYSKGVPMFMRNINDQLNGMAMGLKLSQLLELMKAKDITVWVDWSSKYGVQVRFYEPRG